MDAVLNMIGAPQIWLSTFKILLEQNNNIDDIGPQRIRIETSSACNLRCRHCPTGVDYKGIDRAIMSMETFNKIIDQIKQLKIIHDSVLYLGGEPLMNKNFPLMCKRIKEETSITRTLFNTNGMLLTEEICKELSMANVDQIGISIDGRSPEENDHIRKGSDYATVLKNTKMLKYFLPNVQIGISNTQTKRPGDPEQAVMPDFILHDFSGYSMETSYAMEWPGLDIKNSIFNNISVDSSLKKNFCKRPFTEMAVRPNGDVIICCYDITGQHVVGNIHDSDLLSIWKGKAYKALRSNLLLQRIGSLPRVCKKCVYFTGHMPMLKE
jgi:radical SAM protein with 4Fe4S-binding SPASM domain